MGLSCDRCGDEIIGEAICEDCVDYLKQNPEPGEENGDGNVCIWHVIDEEGKRFATCDLPISLEDKHQIVLFKTCPVCNRPLVIKR